MTSKTAINATAGQPTNEGEVQMDPMLAEIYGTNQVTEEDLEKMAAAELAEGLAGDEAVSEEELEAMAEDVLNGAAEEPEAGDEEQEKVAEADYLGRVMAHAYVQELRGIEKEAGRTHDAMMAATLRDEAAKAARAPKAPKGPYTPSKSEMSQAKAIMKDQGLKPGLSRKQWEKKMVDESHGLKSRAIGGAKRGANAVESFGRKGTDAIANAARSAKASPEGQVAAHRLGQAKDAIGRGASAVGGHLSRNRGKYGVGAAAAALAGGGYAGYKHLTKQSSALDALVEARAMTILEASGIDPETFEEIEPIEKVSEVSNDFLDQVITERAWALLSEFGFEPSIGE